jgi:regulator of sigma D
MKFHHEQKIIITEGYYKTYSGFIKGFRETKDKAIEYQVKVKPKVKEETNIIMVWIREQDLKVSWF